MPAKFMCEKRIRFDWRHAAMIVMVDGSRWLGDGRRENLVRDLSILRTAIVVDGTCIVIARQDSHTEQNKEIVAWRKQ